MRNKKKINKMFSYTNEDKKEKNFLYKDFAKSESYNTNFAGSNFTGINFLNASMKYCNFYNCSFNFVEFENTKLTGANFEGTHFENVLFKNCKLTRAKFKNATFKNVFFYNTSTNNINIKDGIEIITQEKLSFDIDNDLHEMAELCRENILMRKSSPVFKHNKKSEEKYSLNKISILRLRKLFSDKKIIMGLKNANENIEKEFNTLSRLVKFIESS